MQILPTNKKTKTQKDKAKHCTNSITPSMSSSTTTPDKNKRMSEPGLRVSRLPQNIQEEVGRLNLDQDADGKIGSDELRDLIVDLLSTKKDNKSLKKVTIVLAIYGLFLTLATFCVSIAAARLAKDTTVDAATGNLQVKGAKDGQVVHTSPVSYDLQGLNLVALNNKELGSLTTLQLSEGDVNFAVTGFARSVLNQRVLIFVEDGTLLYDATGLVSATGTVDTALAFAGAYADDSSEAGVRRLGDEGSGTDGTSSEPLSESNEKVVSVRVSCGDGTDGGNQAPGFPSRDQKYLKKLMEWIEKGYDKVECRLDENDAVASGHLVDEDGSHEYVTERDLLFRCSATYDVCILKGFMMGLSFFHYDEVQLRSRCTADIMACTEDSETEDVYIVH